MKRTYQNRGSGSTPANPITVNYVWDRDKGICVYCGNPAQVLDHVIRWADNGPSISSNLVCCCNKCNTYKGLHPKGISQLTKAIFWLSTHGEDIKWMEEFYPYVKAKALDSIYFREKVRKPKLPHPPKIRQPRPIKEHEISYRLSTTTTPIALRLPNEVYEILERRASKQGMLTSEYLRRRVIYDTTRSHKKNERKQPCLNKWKL